MQEQLIDWPREAPLAEDQPVVASLIRRMNKARGQLEPLRERVRLELIKASPESDAEA